MTPASTGPTPVSRGTNRSLRCEPYSASTAITNRTLLPATGVVRDINSALDPLAPDDGHHGARHRGDQLGVALGTECIGLAVRDDDRAPGLGHRAPEQEPFASARRKKVDLELYGEN